MGQTVVDVGSSAVSTVSEATTIKEFALPNGWGEVKIYPAIYKIYLTPIGVEALTSAQDFAATVGSLMSAIVTSSGGTLAPVAEMAGRDQAVANDHGVTLRGSYFPPAGLIIPTPGRF